MKKGRIKSYNKDRDFGFIQPDEGSEDLYFHKTVVEDTGYPIEPGARVEYDEGPGRMPGKRQATSVRLLGPAATPSAPGNPQQTHRPAATSPASSLPPECLFQSFYDETHHLRPQIFYDAPRRAAELFRKADLKSNQLRQLYQGFASFARPLCERRISFDAARERFGVFYCERVVRQVERKVLPRVVKDLIDAHRELALSNPQEMLALFRYLTNIYCYFGESDKPDHYASRR